MNISRAATEITGIEYIPDLQTNKTKNGMGKKITLINHVKKTQKMWKNRKQNKR